MSAQVGGLSLIIPEVKWKKSHAKNGDFSRVTKATPRNTRNTTSAAFSLFFSVDATIRHLREKHTLRQTEETLLNQFLQEGNLIF